MQRLDDRKNEQDGYQGTHRDAIGRLLPYLWPEGERGLRSRVVLSMLALLLAKGLTVATPFFYKGAIDRLTLPGGGSAAAVPAALLLGYGMARFLSLLFGEVRDALFIRVNQNAIRKLSLETFSHLHALSVRFHLDRRTGGLTRAIERGTRGLEVMLRFMLFSILPTLFELVMVTAIFAYRFKPVFTLILVAAILGYIGFTISMTEWRTKYRREMNARDREANTRAVDSLINAETVKIFGNETHEAREYDRDLERYQTAAVKAQASLSWLNIGQALIVNLCLGGMMLMAAREMAAGRLSVGDLVLVNTLLLQMFIPLNFLGSVFREMKQGLIDMEYMFGLLDLAPDIRDAPDARPLVAAGGAIEFDRVSFGYTPERPILKDVSFRVPAGGTVAIVGPSGAGKSTISRILFRFYDTESGHVCIDGQDIRAVTQESLRRNLAIVPQDTVLFNASIAYNIGYGRTAASAGEIAGAARMARLDRFLASLRDGLETRVGERGLKLSGGEKQRVAIARAMLKNPPILLLDEATSSLDTETEREIQESLRAASRNRTTLVIAHRLSTVVDADEILVLDHGRIVERGAHRDLLALDGLYARMWQRQQEARKAEEQLKGLEDDPLANAHAADTVSV